MKLNELINDLLFWGKQPPEAIKWEEIRAKILLAIEEEKKSNSELIVPDATITDKDSIVESSDKEGNQEKDNNTIRVATAC